MNKEHFIGHVIMNPVCNNLPWGLIEKQIEGLAEEHKDDPLWKYQQSYVFDIETGKIRIEK